MIRIICIGKLKEKFLVDGVDEYKKRIEGFQKLQILELKEYNTCLLYTSPSPRD